MKLEPLLKRFQGVRRSGGGWKAECPAHEDRNPSLSISVHDGKALLHCHAGCTPEAICAAAEIEMRELFLDTYDGRPRIIAEYDYTNERGELLYQVLRYDPKDFRQRRPDGKGGRKWNMNGVRRVLYRLPEVLAAKSVLIDEGEKDADTAVEKLGLVATCNPGGAGKWRPEYADFLHGKHVTIIADADDPGRKHAQQVAASLYGKVESLKVLELPGARDLTEWVEKGGTREALLGLVRNAAEWKPSIAASTEPPSMPLAEVLTAITVFIRRFVFLSGSQVRILALWVAHTYTIDAADSTPYPAITSPEKQSGKTRLLEVLEILVANPWMTGRVTAAVLSRKIDSKQPTLLLDESDTAFGGEKEYAEALRGVLNTGHRRGGKASCCVGQGANISFRDFSTFCPKAIAGIGKLPDTVADRSIPFRLKRTAPGEGVEKFRRRDEETEAAWLRKDLEAWSRATVAKLREARPELPEELSDRQQDGAEPLLAIADLAGGEWPQAARSALIDLCRGAQAENDSYRVQMLSDIRQIFKDRNRIASTELAPLLAAIETSPWGEWRNGRPISPVGVASLLRPFDISPHPVRDGAVVFRGYEINDFQDAWARYLGPDGNSAPLAPPSQTVTRLQPAPDAASSDFQGVTPAGLVTAQKVEKPAKNAPCNRVTVRGRPTGAPVTQNAPSEAPPRGPGEDNEPDALEV